MNVYAEGRDHWRVSHQWLQQEADPAIWREVRHCHSGFNVPSGCWLVPRGGLSDEVDSALEAEVGKREKEG